MEKIGKIFIFMQKIGKAEGPILEKVVTEGQSAICAMMCYAVIINYFGFFFPIKRKQG